MVVTPRTNRTKTMVVRESVSAAIFLNNLSSVDPFYEEKSWNKTPSKKMLGLFSAERAMYGNVWLCRAMYGCVWLYMAM